MTSSPQYTYLSTVPLFLFYAVVMAKIKYSEGHNMIALISYKTEPIRILGYVQLPGIGSEWPSQIQITNSLFENSCSEALPTMGSYVSFMDYSTLFRLFDSLGSRDVSYNLSLRLTSSHPSPLEWHTLKVIPMSILEDDVLTWGIRTQLLAFLVKSRSGPSSVV